MRIPSFVLAAIFALAPAPIRAQQPRPVQRSIAFFGLVEAVDLERKIVVVKHGKVSGYVESGTTEHPTEGDTVLRRLQSGDNIRATVYPNDLTLHRIQIVYRSGTKGKR
jgi:hypothetical protein